ncbi:jg22940, partial [Pararge aegeria aegeria]
CLKTKVFDQCVLPVMTYGSETSYGSHKKAESSSAGDGESNVGYLYVIESGMSRRTRVTDIAQCWNGDPAQVNAVLVGPQRVGQTTSNESLGAAENKRPRTVDFGTPYKRPMSSSGLRSVEFWESNSQPWTQKAESLPTAPISDQSVSQSNLV